jgi:hypothetical protein
MHTTEIFTTKPIKKITSEDEEILNFMMLNIMPGAMIDSDLLRDKQSKLRHMNIRAKTGFLWDSSLVYSCIQREYEPVKTSSNVWNTGKFGYFIRIARILMARLGPKIYL